MSFESATRVNTNTKKNGVCYIFFCPTIRIRIRNGIKRICSRKKIVKNVLVSATSEYSMKTSAEQKNKKQNLEHTRQNSLLASELLQSIRFGVLCFHEFFEQNFRPVIWISWWWVQVIYTIYKLHPQTNGIQYRLDSHVGFGMKAFIYGYINCDLYYNNFVPKKVHRW